MTSYLRIMQDHLNDRDLEGFLKFYILGDPHNLYSQSYLGSIVHLNGWAGLIAYIGDIQNSYTFKLGNLRGRDLFVNKKPILKLRTLV
jgi:hypothetical protein